MNFSVTRNGKPLSKWLYTWDKEIKTFTTKETGLVLDFADINGVRFKTGSNCVFKTGADCYFLTSHNCTFITGSNCAFETLSHCTFNTTSFCSFVTGYDCIFKTSSDCIFKTDSHCVINRKDTFETINIPTNQRVKLNGYEIRGYELIEEGKHIITLNKKEIELTKEEFYDLWEQMKKRING